MQTDELKLRAAMLEVDGLSKRLGEFSISDVSFTVAEGEYFVLLGASGTGKTILLETLTGFLRPDSGRVILSGRDITEERLQSRKLGIVFQDQALFPHMSVSRNIAYGPVSAGMEHSQIEKLTRKLAAETGIVDLLDRSPATLSGGEAQRAALARALAAGPDCLLLDEPLSSLDSGARIEMRTLLKKLNRSGMTMLHVTHDYEEAAALATKIGIMENGTVVQVDTPKRILSHPGSEFVARFVGIRNVYRGMLASCREGLSQFVAGSGAFRLVAACESAAGEATALVRSEDVVISRQRPDGSSRNVFEGTVTEIIPARGGAEITIEAGEDITAIVTERSVESLGLVAGGRVFASIKANAVRIVEG
jgi:molybdopterin-binding protein